MPSAKYIETINQFPNARINPRRLLRHLAQRGGGQEITLTVRHDPALPSGFVWRLTWYDRLTGRNHEHTANTLYELAFEAEIISYEDFRAYAEHRTEDTPETLPLFAEE